jgi:hypothetical protein
MAAAMATKMIILEVFIITILELQI